MRDDPKEQSGNESVDPAPPIRIVVERGRAAHGVERSFAHSFRVGRDETADFRMPDPEVSRIHLEIYPVDGRWRIRDLESRNGVFIHGVRIDDAELRPGARIELGRNGPVITVYFEERPTPSERERGLAAGKPMTMGAREPEADASVSPRRPADPKTVSPGGRASTGDQPFPQTLRSRDPGRAPSLAPGRESGPGPLESNKRHEPSLGASAPDDPQSLTRYMQHYFNESDTEDAGDHTMMIRRAFARVQKKQRRRYSKVIAVLFLLVLGVSAFAGYQHIKFQQNKVAAEDIFYNMKTLELQLDNLEKTVEEFKNAQVQEQIDQYRSKVMYLEKSYDDYVNESRVYSRRLSPEELVIMRVSRLFGECEVNMPSGFVKEVERYIEKWKTTDRLESAVARAVKNNYNVDIARVLSFYHLPPQFFYLALQESNFYREAAGKETRYGIAKGMWQFIPSTGAYYGLHPGPLADQAVYDPGDDRHDFAKSTLAAARYLRDIYTTEAQASGLLVMASYNWGEENVRGLIRQMPENPKDRNFWKLLEKYRDRIPQETYDYVFYIISACVIGENPKLFGFHFENPLAFAGRRQAAR